MAKTDDGAKNKGNLLTTIALMVVAGGGAFFLVTMVPDGTTAAAACEGAGAENDPHPEIAERRAEHYVALEPLAVSLKPESGARTLRIGLALGLHDAGTHIEEAEILRLKDGFLDTLRRQDSDTITDPDAMPALREQLLGEARAVLGEGAVASLLITDYMMR